MDIFQRKFKCFCNENLTEFVLRVITIAWALLLELVFVELLTKKHSDKYTVRPTQRLNRNHFKKKTVNLATLSSLVALPVVAMTTYCATSDDKVVKLAIFCIECYNEYTWKDGFYIEAGLEFDTKINY